MRSVRCREGGRLGDRRARGRGTGRERGGRETCVRFVPGGGELCVRFVPGRDGGGAGKTLAWSSLRRLWCDLRGARAHQMLLRQRQTPWGHFNASFIPRYSVVDASICLPVLVYLSTKAPPPPPPSCTDWTRLVLLPVLTGHVSSFASIYLSVLVYLPHLPRGVSSLRELRPAPQSAPRSPRGELVR